jgi:hypothetical protein
VTNDNNSAASAEKLVTLEQKLNSVVEMVGKLMAMAENGSLGSGKSKARIYAEEDIKAASTFIFICFCCYALILSLSIPNLQKLCTLSNYSRNNSELVER